LANYTLTSIASLLSRLSYRTDETNTFWGQDEKLNALTEALNLWQCLVGCYTAKWTAISSGISPYIKVPKQLACVTRVLMNGKALTQVSIKELDCGFVGWEISQETVPQYWAACGINNIVIYPWNSIQHLEIYGYSDLQKPQQDDWLNLGNEVINYILDYAVGYLELKEGVEETKNLNSIMQNLLQIAVKQNEKLYASGIYNRYLGKSREPDLVPTPKEPLITVR